MRLANALHQSLLWLTWEQGIVGEAKFLLKVQSTVPVVCTSKMKKPFAQ
jgi:hypothetical protein